MSHHIGTIHPHSREAYHAELDKLNRREREIYDLLLRVGEPMSDRTIVHALGFTDMNNCRPRITALLDDDWLSDCGSVRCPATNRAVRICKANTPEQRHRIKVERDQGQGSLL